MRIFYYTILLTLFSIVSLSAQSLYQDALSLAEILRKERQGQNQGLESEAPKIVIEKECKGISCNYNQFNPVGIPFFQDEEELQTAMDTGFYFPEVYGNQVILYSQGYYTLQGFDQTDSIYIKFAKNWSIKIYSEADSLVFEQITAEKGVNDILKFPMDSLLSIHNTYKKLSILGSNRTVLAQYKQEEIDSKIRAYNRRILLRPEDWDQAPVDQITGISQDQSGYSTPQISIPFNKNETRLIDGYTFTLKQKKWSSYLIHFKQGEEYLTDEYSPIRIIDSLQVTYDRAKKQISGFNINVGYAYNSINLKKDSLSPLRLQGSVEYTLKTKNDVLSLDLDDLMKHPTYRTPSDSTILATIETSLYAYDGYSYKLDTLTTNSTYLDLPMLENNDTVGYSLYIRYGENIRIKPNHYTLWLLTDRNGNLHLIPSLYVYLAGDFLSYNYPFVSVPFLYKTRDLRDVAFILSTHHNFNNQDLQKEGILKETLFAYKNNEILSSPLTTYLAQEQSIEQSLNKSGGWKLDQMYRQYYPWQGVIYQDLRLNLNKKTSYQAVLANARQQANTASKNLQRVTQQLATQQKANRGGGLNAATIAAGLSDFIVESAQEELNMNFLTRMRDQITNNYPEFQILFPNTIERFTDFQVTQYRSFLGNSKLAFEADLNNIGFSFPTLFTDERTRAKYAVLADDPNVYNISLVYDIANKVYEETPIDSVFLHLYTRLDDRLNDLDKRVINTMSGQLVKSEEGKTEVAYLKEETQAIFDEIDDFDFLIQVENENMQSVLDSLQRKQQEIGEKTRKSYLEAAKKIYSNQYEQDNSYYPIQNIADYNMAASLSNYNYTPYGNIIRSNQIPDSLRSTSRKMGNNFIAPIQLNPIADSLKNENIISYGNEQFVTSTKLKQYEAVINTSLAGKIRYDYMLKKLPYEQFDDYFKTVPTDSMMVSEGLFLLDDLLKEEQLLLRRAWLKNYSDFLESNLATLKERQRNQLQTLNPYPDELARFYQLSNQQRQIDAILYDRVIDLQQKAKTFKLLEGLYQTLDKNYKALAKAYERAKEEKKSEEQLNRIIEKQLDRDRNYLQDYVDQQTKNLYEEEAYRLEEESKKMLEDLALRYQQLKENNASSRSLEQQLDTGIQAINRSFQIRFDKIEAEFFQKQEKYKDKKIRSTSLERYRIKEYGDAYKSFSTLREQIVNQADSIEFHSLQRQLESAEAIFDQNLEKAFLVLEEEIESVDRLEWRTQKDAESIVERKVASLENRLDQKSQASQIKRQRIIRKEQKSIDHIIDRRFSNLKNKLLKDNNGRLSSRKYTDLDQRRESVKNSLQTKIDQINNILVKNETSVDRARALMHAAQSLEYLRLKFQELYNSGNSDRLINRDQEINRELWNATNNFSSTNLYTIYDDQMEAIKEKARIQEELINKTIGVLTQLEVEYGIEENKYRYIPTPTQTEINDLLSTLPDSSKTDLFTYYGNENNDFYYLENPNNYSKQYGQEFLLRNVFKKSQDTLYLSSIQYLNQLQEEELILIRKLDKGEQSLDFVNYFERTLELNKTMNLWLDSIAIQFDTLSNHFTRLEEEYAERAHEAKEHAKELSTLTELSVHLLDAFRLGSYVMDSITIADTLRQRIEETIENKKISYDRLAVQQKVIAKGSSVNKWISRAQFRRIMEDSLTQQAYLGLLYQRLSNIKGLEEISPDGVALVSSKLINTIYNMDDLRATLQYKKRLGKTLGFQDYYPFIRTVVDFMNIVLETPIGERSFSEQHQELETFALISDQSLKLFDNISSENYGQSIDNLINIFSYIWDVDVEQATQENQWTQAMPTLKLQGKDKEVAAIEKQLKKIQNEEQKELRKGQKNNRKLKKALTVYGKFIANIAMAEDANSVKVALKSVAAPPGSSSVKRNSRANVSVNSYFGGGFYREQLNLSSLTKEERTSGSVGLSVPVGVTGTVGGIGKNNWSVSLFVPILDLGIFTAYRIDQQNAGQSADLPDLNFGNLIAPGGFLIVNIPKSPFSISGGAQFGPQLRETTVNGNAELTSAWRYGVTATIDVPIFNLFNR